MNAANLEGRHPSTVDLAQWFEFAHLPEHLQSVSKQVHDVAEELIGRLPDSAELSAGLRKLIEAKDCFVRAAISAKK